MKEQNLTAEKMSHSEKTAKYWSDNQMRSAEWYKVKPEESEIFKTLIRERYGWPEYVLNFNAEEDSIMKVEIF